MEIPRRHWRNLDWPLLVAVGVLIAFGMIIIYSASYSRLAASGDDPFHYVKRQALGGLVGLIGMIFVVSLDYRALRRWSRLMYISSVGLLALVLFLGTTVFGSQRWLNFGPLRIQPSELAKIVIIVVLAKYLEKAENTAGWKILCPLLLVSGPMAFIMLQPDLGTSMVFVGITFSMLYLSGANVKHLGILAASAAGISGLAIYLSMQDWMPFRIIKPYQLTRLLVFLDPFSDPTGSGWNVIQSMIAVGSGGFVGKGLLGGSQNQLNFLPANHTDFVFSVVGEELGFVGAVFVLSLYLFILWRGLKIALLAKDRFGQGIAAGCVSMFFFHLVINVGMTLGIMPVTGLPLPFVTYGGSTLLTSLLAIGLLLNVGLRRKKIMF